MDENKLLYLVLLGCVLCLGCFLRLDGIDRGLEYDEIWPLHKFRDKGVWDILVSLDFPNLHPIAHAIAGKYGEKQYLSEFEYRQWSLFAGVLLLIIVALYSYHLTSSYEFCLFATSLCALDPYLIHYAHTARGYSMQCCFAVLLAYLLAHDQWRKNNPIFWGIALFSTILLLQGSVVTSLLIWLPLCGVYIAKWNEQSFASLFPVALATLVIGVWLFATFEALRSGTQYKSSHWTSFYPLLAPHLHILWIIGLYLSRGKQLFPVLLALLATMLAFITVTRLPGPTRVYTYFLPFLLITAAYPLYAIAKAVRRPESPRLPFLALLFAVIAASFVTFSYEKQQLEGPDYKQLVSAIDKRNQEHCYLAFPIHRGLPIRYYHPEVNAANIRKLVNRQKLCILLVEQPENHPRISVSDMRGEQVRNFDLSPQSIDETMTIAGTICHRISPRRGQPTRFEGVLFAAVVIEDEAQYRRLHRKMQQQSSWYLVNFLFTHPAYIPTQSGMVRLAAYLFCAEVHSQEEWERVQQLMGKGPRYYWLR